MRQRWLLCFLSFLLLVSLALGACSQGAVEESSSVISREESASSHDGAQNESNPDQNDESDADQEESGEESNSDEGGEEMENQPIVRPQEYPTLCGSFMQPGTFKHYNDKQMEDHLQTMYEAGIDILILQWSFTTQGDKVTSAYFDTTFPGTFDKSGKKLLETILKAAEKTGVKVFVGLNENEEWWQKGVSDKNWLTTQAELGVEGAKQIYDTYKESYPNALYGWYFVLEFYNMQADAATVDNAAYVLSQYRNGLAELDGDMPMMLSPFLSSYGAGPEDTGKLWADVFAKADFRDGDIFCCQDSVGAGHITMAELEPYYAAIKAAVDTKEGLHFWANNEDFTQSNWTTAPFDRFMEQLRITDPYVEAHVTFAYSHYQHPDVGRTGHHLAYKTYFETGEIPGCTLPAPTVDYTVEQDGAEVIITGSVSNTDGNALGFLLVKDGEELTFIDLTTDYGKAELTFSYTDYNTEGDGKTAYEVYAVDYFRGRSVAASFTVDFTPKNGSNVALDCPYTSTAPETGYPDEDQKGLTDGKKGQAMYYDPAWMGFLGKPEFVIDLGKQVDGIYSVEVSTLGGGSAGVFAPNQISVYVSDDGVTFTKVTDKAFDSDPNIDGSTLVLRNVVLNKTVSARYVKVAIATDQSWIFVDEISVFAE